MDLSRKDLRTVMLACQFAQRWMYYRIDRALARGRDADTSKLEDIVEQFGELEDRVHAALGD